jgi:hypothetical protein
MAQPVYPTLGVNPDEGSFVREPAIDPTERTPLEDGALLVMKTKTKVPLRWSFVYTQLSGTNKASLDSFWEGDANCGAVPIKFTDPTNSTDYFVQFMSQPRSTLEDDGQATWRVEINFLEAIGTYT